MNCTKYKILPQFSATCWFNAILMCMYYSDGGRKIFLNNFNKNKSPIHEVINDLLKYQEGKTTSVFKPEYLIRKLYHINKDLFNMNVPILNAITPKFIIGAFPLYGIKNFLEYVYKKNFAIICGIPIKNKPTQFSLHTAPNYNINCINAVTFKKIQNSKYFVMNINKEKPELIIISIDNRKKGFDWKNVAKDDLKSIFDMNKKVCIIDGVEYVQDSMILMNYNTLKTAHVVAGLTCNETRYIYNGWTINTFDQGIVGKMYNRKPCDLFPIDWMSYDSSFCINPLKCDLPKVLDKATEKKVLCFNPKHGSIDYFMIRKDIYDQINKPVSVKKTVIKPVSVKKTVIKPVSVKKCPEGKVINPKTNRCIKKPTSIKVKTCPKGKVINPKTNRCIKIKN